MRMTARFISARFISEVYGHRLNEIAFDFDTQLILRERERKKILKLNLLLKRYSIKPLYSCSLNIYLTET